MSITPIRVLATPDLAVDVFGDLTAPRWCGWLYHPRTHGLSHRRNYRLAVADLVDLDAVLEHVAELSTWPWNTPGHAGSLLIAVDDLIGLDLLAARTTVGGAR